MCPQDSFLNGIEVRADTTMDIGYSGLRIKCKNPKTDAARTLTLFDALNLDFCNPGLFEGVRWTCKRNRSLHTGSRCPGGWERCQPGANPGSFQNQQWVCPADRSLETGRSCGPQAEWIKFGQWKQQQRWKSAMAVPRNEYVKGAQAHVGAQVQSYRGGLNGLRLLVDELHFGVSTQPIEGYWQLVGSGSQVTFSVTESMTLSSGSSVTTEESFGFNQEISAGFEASIFGIGVDTSVSVGAEQAFTTSRTVESTLERTREITFEASCGDELPEEGGRWFLYQWKMEQESDGFGPGFEMASNHFVCTNSFSRPPRCPLGFCANDADCQSCIAPFEFLNSEDY